MKKLVAALAMGLMVVSSASALKIVKVAGYQSGDGGEFTVLGSGYEVRYDADASMYSPMFDLWGFQTFCLEKDENLSTAPDGYTIESYAVQGGVGGAVADIGGPGIDGDPLSVGTAWLYRKFSDGALDGYDYDPDAGRTASAVLLQEAIWWLEDELGGAYDISGNGFVSLASSQLGLTDVELKASASPGEYGVAVMNVVENGEHRQSLLVRVPDGGMTLVLLGASVLGCVALRRRFSK